MKPFLLIPALIATIVVGAPAIAKKKPWDMARYADCVRSDRLADGLVVSSALCRNGRVASKSFNDPRQAKVLATVHGRSGFGSSNSKMFLHVLLSYQNSNAAMDNEAILSASAASYAISGAAALLEGKSSVLDIYEIQDRQRDCGSIYRGSLLDEKCDYRELAKFVISSEVILAARVQYQSDIGAKIPIKINSSHGANWVVSIPVAEILAVDAALNATP